MPPLQTQYTGAHAAPRHTAVAMRGRGPCVSRGATAEVAERVAALQAMGRDPDRARACARPVLLCATSSGDHWMRQDSVPTVSAHSLRPGTGCAPVYWTSDQPRVYGSDTAWRRVDQNMDSLRRYASCSVRAYTYAGMDLEKLRLYGTVGPVFTEADRGCMRASDTAKRTSWPAIAPSRRVSVQAHTRA